jgi:hypothetical protein
MPKSKPYLGKIQGDHDYTDPLALDQALAMPFQADDHYTSTEAGRHINPEHDAAIAKAMKPLYGGLVGSRCDPVEEWPGDFDEPYGIPQSVQPLGVDYPTLDGDGRRDDAPIIRADKSGKLDRQAAISDLSGATDRIANDDDFAERDQPDRDDSFTTHH